MSNKSTIHNSQKIMDVKDLIVNYGEGKNTFTAVKGISFHIPKNKTLGLVGESGCGKTSTGMAILRLIPAAGGSILWQGTDILSLSKEQFFPYRKHIQIIFQNPDSSLNPRIMIKSSLKEAMELGYPDNKQDWNDIIADKLLLVGLNTDYQNRYPHELSGGQLQRVGIARALCVNPQLIICDEPVSSLDVSIQAQILNLLIDLQDTLGLSYLFISHDLSVVRHISHDVAVMRNGHIREFGPVQSVFSDPQSTYTKKLLEAVPR
ncbi:MAG: ABC transporter ATP-binding protein [Fibrobacteria bacterium]|nr:ABC transporter ATP-binding protein [Fibrobacteria bacterium]